MAIKRSRDNQGDDLQRSIAMVNYTIMLSQGSASSSVAPTGRVFECKTCNRQFPSFQALGGHRASHKKPRLTLSTEDDHVHEKAGKPKTHECSICGLEFAAGQALGGHMRRHRAVITESQHPVALPFLGLSLPSTNNAYCNTIGMKKIIGGESTRTLSLDLNLTPLENGLFDLKTVGCSLAYS